MTLEHNLKMYRRALQVLGTVGLFIGLGWPLFAIAGDSHPYLNISISPAQPTDQDTLTANYIFLCSGPLSIDQTSVVIGAVNVDVQLKITCGPYGGDIGMGSVSVGTLGAGNYTLRLVLQGRGEPGAPYNAPYVAATSQFTVQSQEQATSVVEFYHEGLDHYFMTGNADEAASLNSNPQLGWQPTGQTFGALTALSHLTGPLNTVCRFYGSVAPGPNSHFYTLDPTECNFLKQLQQTTSATLPRWNFEGVDFVAAAPQGNGACPDEYPLAVRRFYNNRALQADSNHRYVTDVAVAQQMRAAGWLDEGVVMCGLAG